MSCSVCSSQDGSTTNTPSELDSQLSSERECARSPTLMKQDSISDQQAESSSSLSSSSSSPTCCKEEKVEMTCTVQDCGKSAYKSRRYQLLPWKCKYHRNKTYKETYKRRKAQANQDLFNVEGKSTGLDMQGDRFGATTRQRQGEQVSMLEQALMQSPVVLEFLQKQQQRKHHQQKHQQKSWGLQQIRGRGQPSHR
ncbi:regulatory factor X-associated protein-like isoform X2 [Acanthaster planci]|uniref:Regulatory factor X-associated protein-like isoform X2 n=1 Tax=Acanthaster planci TaxID=133434 RepID=A0A8B7ZXI5_ACAPL|nr:regulatory factor X-associated protein-like isoform X2 [Acanthaster planci]